MGTRSEWVIDKTEAVSADGMVTAMQPAAAEVGAEILRQGGSAIDAAVATAFAIGVVEPFMSGIGGIAFLVYRDAATGETTCLDGSSVLPKAIRPDMFELLPEGETSGMYGWRGTKGDAAQTGWLAPAVPGMPSLCGEAHSRWGRLPWSDVIAPSIKLAEGGFEVNYYIAMMTSANFERLGQFPESKKTFFKPNGAPLAPSVGGPGDKLVQADLARTLRLIAEEGVDTIYRGEIGRLIAEDMARNGGLITEEDLLAHQTLATQAASIDYRGHQLVGQLENTGNATVIEALKILEGFDVGKLGFQSPEALHLIAESIRLAFLDRLRWLGDASLQPVPYGGVVDAAYAAQRREAIERGRAHPDATFGDPWAYEPGVTAVPAARVGQPGEGQTTHLNVIDRDHNMVTLTSTLGSAYGSGVVIKGTGITLNNATMWFDPVPGAVTSIGSGKRIMSAASPLLVMRDGAPAAAVGSPGGRRVISAVYQVLLNMIDFQRGIQKAISAPRVHSEGPAVEISTRFPAETITALEDLGHPVARREDSLSTSFFARPSGIRIDPETGELHGGVHPYTPATAVGG